MNALILPVFCFLLLFSSFSDAQETIDMQTWSNVTAIGPVCNGKERSKFKYWLEGVLRLGDNSSRSTQRILRPGLGYVLNDTASVWFGSAWIETGLPLSPVSIGEKRIWQQLFWTNKYSQLTLFNRLRLEQRFFSNNPIVGWRLRHMLKISSPWAYNPKWTFIGSDELFLHKSRTQNQSVTGFDQNRFFMGMGYKINTALTVEVGYLNQYIYRHKRNHFLSNDIATNILFNF